MHLALEKGAKLLQSETYQILTFSEKSHFMQYYIKLQHIIQVIESFFHELHFCNVLYHLGQ